MTLNHESKSIYFASERRGSRNGYLYAFRDGPVHVKIGWASDWKRRFRTLRTGNARLRVEVVLQCVDAYRTEQLLHRELKSKDGLHDTDEWFYLTTEQVLALFEREREAQIRERALLGQKENLGKMELFKGMQGVRRRRRRQVSRIIGSCRLTMHSID